MEKPSEHSSNKVAITLSRSLELFDLVMMGVGAMIGAGAVMGMGESVRIAGPGGTLLAFLLDGILALVIAMAYAELSSAIPKAGGIYNFARIGIGPGVGFMSGWISWFASAAAGSLYASLCGIYLIHYLGQLGLLAWLPLATIYQERAVAVVLAALFVWVNYRGISETGIAQNLLTLGQMIFLGLIAVAGLVTVASDPSRLANFRPFMPNGWPAVLVCMGFEFVAFEGFEVIATAGDEAIEPRRTLPKAILSSVIIVTAVYVSVGFALIVGVRNLGMPAWEWLGAQGEKGFGEVMARLMPLGGLLATLTVIFASTSALNATIYAAARASYALGRDAMLPLWFGHVSHRFRTPHVALGFTAVILIGLAALFPIVDAASSASVLFLFMFLLACVAVIRVRQTLSGRLSYGYLMPFFPVLPVIAIAVQLVLAVSIMKVSWLAWAAALAWCSAGLTFYLVYAKHHARPIQEDIFTLQEPPKLPEGERHLLVPVADPEVALRLAGPVSRLAQARNASVELLRIVTLPDQVPLSDAPLHAPEGKESIAKVMRHLTPRLSISESVRYCRQAARGILARARAGHHELIAIDWQQGPALGTTLRAVLRHASCDVVVFRGCGSTTYRRVLVAIIGQRSHALALEVAAALADPESGKAVVVRALGPGMGSGPRQPVEHEIAPAAMQTLAAIQTKTVVSQDLTQAVADAAGEADVIVVAVTEKEISGCMRRSVLPERIASLTDRPLVVVRASGGFRSMLGRWHWRPPGHK